MRFRYLVSTLCVLVVPTAVDAGGDADAPAVTIVLDPDGGVYAVGFGANIVEADGVILDPHITQPEQTSGIPTPPEFDDDCDVEADHEAVTDYIDLARAYSVEAAYYVEGCAGDIQHWVDQILDPVEPGPTPGADADALLIPWGVRFLTGTRQVPGPPPSSGWTTNPVLVPLCAASASLFSGEADLQGALGDCEVCSADIERLFATTRFLDDLATQCSELSVRVEALLLDIEEGIDRTCAISALRPLSNAAGYLLSSATRARDNALAPFIDAYCSLESVAVSCDNCAGTRTPLGPSGAISESEGAATVLAQLIGDFNREAMRAEEELVSARYAAIAKALSTADSVRHVVLPSIGEFNVRYVGLADPDGLSATDVFVVTAVAGGEPGTPFDVDLLQQIWADFRFVIEGSGFLFCAEDSDCDPDEICLDGKCEPIP